MTVKQIANIIPTMQSVALVSENLRVAKKKKVTTKDIVNTGMKNIVGTEMIKINSQLIGTL